jgi:hypothetical protein
LDGKGAKLQASAAGKLKVRAWIAKIAECDSDDGVRGAAMPNPAVRIAAIDTISDPQRLKRSLVGESDHAVWERIAEAVAVNRTFNLPSASLVKQN